MHLKQLKTFVLSSTRPSDGKCSGGYSLVETLVGVAILGTSLAGLLSGLTLITAMTQSAREEAQATYIAAETLDTLRLYSWDQLTNKAFLPPTFTVTYGADGLEWEYERPQQPTSSKPSGLKGLLGVIGSIEQGVMNEEPSEAVVVRPTGYRAYKDLVFRGTLMVTNSPVSEDYGADVRSLIVVMQWQSGSRNREAEMSMMFARFGMQGQLVN